MKLVRYGEAGAERPGLIDKTGQVRDLSELVDDIAGAVLTRDGLARLSAIDAETLPMAPTHLRFGPCVGRIGKFICIGLNYADHAAESNLPVPEKPIIFGKLCAATGANDSIIIPRDSQKTDWEVELGVVIGDVAAHVSEADALSYVAGYCIINDVSERRFQLEEGGQWVKGKSCDSFGPIGPWLVTADEVPDPQQLGMWLDVNGERKQNGSTKTMVFGVAALVAHLSKFMTLRPGDVISTGTPPGVGMGQKPHPQYLKPGDVVRLGIEGLGEQEQRCVAYTG
jgi:2-keto-4-pentenoate hydratase/2-oxohepta-3-ene-1,7-dioic acid hydratase in catechol pathway